MKKLIVMVGLVMLLAGCGHAAVNVDMDSCQERGKIDGVRVGQCQPVKLVK